MADKAAVAWVETNVSSAEEAGAMVDDVVGRRLAACANVSRIESVYWWDGKLDHAAEFHVHFKTTPALVKACAAAVRAKHSYEVPYLAWATTAGVDPAYAAWLKAEARAPRSSTPTRRKT